jgi:hypothetical protein
MTYGLNRRAFVEDGPQMQLAHAAENRSTARAWRALDEARKLQLVEIAMMPANDCMNAYPLAL